MPRFEYKYYMPLDYLDDLRKDILPFLAYDKYMVNLPKKEYTVRSVYLDSACLMTYYEKEAGIVKRNKFRIRGYNSLSSGSVVFLEIKRKEVDYVSKNRAKLCYRELNKFIDTKDFSRLHPFNDMNNNSEARIFLYHYTYDNLHPTIVVTYEREAFECKFNSGLRITFDKNVRSRVTNSFDDLFDDSCMSYEFKDAFVLEVKFEKIIPSWLPAVLRKYNVMREAVSKYASGIEMEIDKMNLIY